MDENGLGATSLGEWGAQMNRGLNQFLYDIGKGWDNFWWGDPRTDPEGRSVRVGGWAMVLNPRRNPKTLPPGDVHLRGEEEWKDYTSPDGIGWRQHEHQHLEQIEEMGEGWYLIEIIFEYATTLSHDNAPLEIDADNARDDTKWRPPFP